MRMLLVALLLVALPALAWAQLPHFHLMAPEEVAALASDPNLMLLDVRPLEGYLAGHLPGAVHFPAQALLAPQGGLPGQFLEDSFLQHLFQRVGVGDGSHVVVYTAGEATPDAALVAYTLERLGHGLVGYLNGGVAAWQAQSRPLSQTYPAVTPGQLILQPRPSMRLPAQEVSGVLGRAGVVLVDARPALMFTGQQGIWVRAGHLPGAVSVPWRDLMTPGNPQLFRPLDELRDVFMRNGVTRDQQVIVYGGTVGEGALGYLALADLLGFPNVRLYEGGWTEWAALSGMPIATGPAQPPGAGAPTLTTVRPAADTAPAPAAVAIRIVDSAYQPASAQVRPGQQVTWTNAGTLPHTATADTPLFDSGTISPGQSWSYTVPTTVQVGANIYFHCTFPGRPGDGTQLGSGMAGVLRVVGP